jgi:hypothetical protein
MNRDEVRVVLRTVLTVMGRIARKTSTPTDDFMVAVLNTNEEKLLDAVLELLGQAKQPPSEEMVAAALLNAGIKV